MFQIACRRRDGLRILVERSAEVDVGAPLRRVGLELTLEREANLLVRRLVAATLMDLEQLQIRQRAGRADRVEMAVEQGDRGLVLAEHDEELGLLLEVDQLFHRRRQRPRRLARRRRVRRSRGLRHAGVVRLRCEHGRHLEPADRRRPRHGQHAGRALAPLRRMLAHGRRHRDIGGSDRSDRGRRRVTCCGARELLALGRFVEPARAAPLARAQRPERGRQQSEEQHARRQRVDEAVRVALALGLAQTRLQFEQGLLLSVGIALQPGHARLEPLDALALPTECRRCGVGSGLRRDDLRARRIDRRHRRRTHRLGRRRRDAHRHARRRREP